MKKFYNKLANIFAKKDHTHSKSEVGLSNVDNTADSAKSVKYATSAGSANSVTWANVSGKPSTFTPTSHTHTIANIANLQTALDAKTSNTGTITGIKMNGASKGVSGIVDLGTVLTGGSQTTTSTADGGVNVYTFSNGSTINIKNGSKGSTGPKGDKGDTGARGATGPAGATPTIKAAAGSSIGSVGTPLVTASTSGTTTTFTIKIVRKKERCSLLLSNNMLFELG